MPLATTPMPSRCNASAYCLTRGEMFLEIDEALFSGSGAGPANMETVVPASCHVVHLVLDTHVTCTKLKLSKVSEELELEH